MFLDQINDLAKLTAIETPIVCHQHWIKVDFRFISGSNYVYMSGWVIMCIYHHPITLFTQYRGGHNCTTAHPAA